MKGRKITNKEFKIKANEIHNGKYRYDKVVYINSHIKVIITCPIHGDFEQRPTSHITMKVGCRECGK